MAAKTKPGYYSARPILRIDGDKQQAAGEIELQSLLVEENTLGLFRCEANLLNWGPKNGKVGFVYFDGDIFDFGKTLSVEFRAQGDSSPVFSGRITGIEAHYPPDRVPEIQILAEDRFQDLRMERHTRTFENISDADVIRQVMSSSAHGLSVQVDIDGPMHPVLVQFNQSDLAFLRERAVACDAELWIDDCTIYVQARSRRDMGKLELTWRQDLHEFSVLADLAHQRNSVRVTGWSSANKDIIQADARDSVIGSELMGGQSGSAILSRALASHKDQIVTAMPLTQAEARNSAENRYRSRARSFVRGYGVSEGNVKLRVGCSLTLNGLGPVFNGPYYVTAARHTFSMEDGYLTAFEVERPGLGG